MEDTLSALFVTPLLCFSSIFSIIWYVAGVISIVGIIFWILMLIDVIKRSENEFPGKGKDQKLIWVLLIIFTSYIGSLIYYFIVYRKEGAAK